MGSPRKQDEFTIGVIMRHHDDGIKTVLLGVYHRGE